MQRPARDATVAHAREQVHALARDPVGRALVADQLAPAAAARLPARVLAVGHRARARDDADAVGAGERARPAADHVVAAAVARGVEQLATASRPARRSSRCPRRRRAGRRTQRRCRPARGTARRASRGCPRCRRGTRGRDAVGQVVDARADVARRAASPSPSMSAYAVLVPPPSTPRYIAPRSVPGMDRHALHDAIDVPAGFGRSGVRPSASDCRSAKLCATIAWSSAISRSRGVVHS